MQGMNLKVTTEILSESTVIFYQITVADPGDFIGFHGNPFQIGINKSIYNHALINYSC